jgi:hypothetical protein
MRAPDAPISSTVSSTTSAGSTRRTTAPPSGCDLSSRLFTRTSLSNRPRDTWRVPLRLRTCCERVSDQWALTKLSLNSTTWPSAWSTLADSDPNAGAFFFGAGNERMLLSQEGSSHACLMSSTTKQEVDSLLRLRYGGHLLRGPFRVRSDAPRGRQPKSNKGYPSHASTALAWKATALLF